MDNEKNKEAEVVPEDVAQGEEKSYLGYNTEADEADDAGKGQPSKQKSVGQAVSDARVKAQKLFESKFSQVASNPSSRKFIIAGFIIMLGGLSYFVFTSTKSPEVVQKEAKEKEQNLVETKKEELIKTAAPAPVVPAVDVSKPTAPVALPEPPPIVNPQPPEPPPPPVPSTPVSPTFPVYPSNSGGSAAPIPIPGEVSASESSSTGLFQSGADSEEKRKQHELRRKASIMVVGGGGGGGQGGQGGQQGSQGGQQGGQGGQAGGGKESKSEAGKETDKTKETQKKGEYLGFGNGALETVNTRTSQATSISATFMGNLDCLIAEGKMIDAVLETAINTDIPGLLRAIVSRDVYAESGKNILVPKGSRLIGIYSVTSSSGGASGGVGAGASGGGGGGSGGSGNSTPQATRVAVIWQRLIRPDGVDMALNSPGTDDLGRAGVAGYVDNKFWLQMGSAFLTSYLIPTLAVRFTNLKNQAVSTTNSASTAGVTQTTTTGTVGSQQLQDSLNKFRDLSTQIVQNTFNTNPTITIDQGTTLKVFVNQDIIFPPQFVNNGLRVLK